MSIPNAQPTEPKLPAVVQAAEPRAQELQYLKQIADHLNFIKSAIILFGVLSLLGVAVQFCAASGLFR